MTVKLAPTWWQAALRTAALALAVLVVTLTVYAGNGAPTESRRHNGDEFKRFAPTLSHGIIQLLGETGIVVLIAWFARQKLKVRL